MAITEEVRLINSHTVKELPYTRSLHAAGEAALAERWT